jgi:hypothetical protein
VAQGILWTAVGSSGEGFYRADQRLVLGIFTGLQVWQRRQQGLGRIGVAAQRCEPGPVSGEVLVPGEPVAFRGLCEFTLGSIPVTE